VFNTTFAYGRDGRDGLDTSEMLPGHRYLVDLQERERERELRLVEEEEDEGCPEFLWKDRGAYYADGEPIVLGLDEPVEFMVLPLEN
jgi:hypothetical protein